MTDIPASSLSSSLYQSGLKLPYRIKFAYGVGHVFNDLCAGMWFSYLLLYFHKVLQFPNNMAGLILLIGQVADAICTPFVGIQADRDDNFILCRYGRRKAWHLVGTVCTLFTFPFIFMRCVNCEDSSEYAQLFYYSMLVIIFQFGWASVQISHLSLIPDLTSDKHERTELNAIRYGFLVGANILDYIITWTVIGLHDGAELRIGPSDDVQFRNIVLILIACGLVFAAIFHIFTPERRLANERRLLAESQATYSGDGVLVPKITMTWSDWLKEPVFYQVAVLYMCTRLYVNVTQVYVPMYLQEYVQLGKTSVAIIPLVMYVTGFLSAFLMKWINKTAGRKLTYLIGGVLAIGACIWFQLGSGPSYRNVWLYVATCLAGSATSIVLVTSLSITADLIGDNVESGGFVYGAMSFTDKLGNGVAVMLVQNLYPCGKSTEKASLGLCGYYYRDVLSYGCGGTVVLALIALLTLLPVNVGVRKKGQAMANGRTYGTMDVGTASNEAQGLLENEEEGVRNEPRTPSV